MATHLQGQYRVGQEISFKEKEDSHSSLKDHTYTITGFVDSAESSLREIWATQEVEVGL